MKTHVFYRDLKGQAYRTFLEALFAASASFSLTWRDQFRFAATPNRVEPDLLCYKLGTRRSDRWPGTRLFEGAGLATVQFYRCDPAAIEVLMRPGSLFSWLQPEHPEDLSFYREDREAILATVSHEEEAWVLDRKLVSIVGRMTALEVFEVSDDVLVILKGAA